MGGDTEKPLIAGAFEMVSVTIAPISGPAADMETPPSRDEQRPSIWVGVARERMRKFRNSRSLTVRHMKAMAAKLMDDGKREVLLERFAEVIEHRNTVSAIHAANLATLIRAADTDPPHLFQMESLSSVIAPNAPSVGALRAA